MNSKLVEVEKGQARKFLVIGAAFVTLFFWTACNDPFNAPKSWVLSIIGFWLLGWVCFQIKGNMKQAPLRWAIILATAYILAMTAALMTTDNKYIGFFGEYQRRTGYLSYLCLITIFLASAFIFRLKSSKITEATSTISGFVLALYGFAQHFNKDFVHWVNPYNPVLTTLGNPDFAAAIMAIFLILNFGIAIQPKYSTWFRILAALNTILLFVVILFSQVRQGLLAGALGIVIITIVWVYQRNRIASFALLGSSIIIGFLGIMGMLNNGPLSHFFYKTSVTYRGDYWRAGWRMFVHHPLFGVGLDRYGANFRQYRDAAQSLRRGPDLVSNAAHNVPIQLAATGGIFTLLTFLALTAFIFWRGIVALRKTVGSEQIAVAVFFAAWIAYQAQSFISIDNLAIAIWGYLLGGVIVGISVIDEPTVKIPKKRVAAQQFISLLLAICALTVSVVFYQSESAYHKLLMLPKIQSRAQVQQFTYASRKPLTYGFAEPTFNFTYARNLAEIGNFDGAKLELTKLINSDGKNYEAVRLLAEINEYLKNWSNAAVLRRQIIKLDPYNQVNLLQLGEDEKYLGNLSDAKAIIPLINAFAPNSQEAKQAEIDFGK